MRHQTSVENDSSDSCGTPSTSWKHKPKKRSKFMSCLSCESGKRSCDRTQPTCKRCARIGKVCVYRHSLSLEEQVQLQIENRKKRLGKDSSKTEDYSDSSVVCHDRIRGAFPSDIPSVSEISKIECMMDEFFLTACFDNFYRHIGAALQFGDKLRDHNGVYATPTRSVLTDAVLSIAFRGMGWVEHARLCQNRARLNAEVLFSDVTAESHTAASILGLALIGGEMVHYKYLMGHSAQIKNPKFLIDYSRTCSYFFDGCLLGILHPATHEIFLLVRENFFVRVQVHAAHVRRVLEAKLSLVEIATYGPWDYADHREGYSAGEDMNMDLAEEKLAQIDVAEQRISELAPKVLSALPEFKSIFSDLFLIPAAGLRCVLYNYLGDVEAARGWGYETLKLYSSVTCIMWFFTIAEDLVHVVDVSIGIQDKALFDQGMTILRRMSPFYPIAEKLVFALANSPDLFGGDSLQIEIVEVVEETMAEMLKSCGDLDHLEDIGDSEVCVDDWLDTPSSE